MDEILTYDIDKMDSLNSQAVMKLIEKHKAKQVPHYQKLLDYYMGEQAILQETRVAGAPNAQVVCNHAKDIADTSSGYFLGVPIAYSLKDDSKKNDFDMFQDALDKATVTDDDQESALSLAIFGKCFEYDYAAEEVAELRAKSLSPLNAFVVYDQTIEHKKLFGVYYYQVVDPLNETGEPDTKVLVMTDSKLSYYTITAGSGDNVEPDKEEDHNLGQVPLIEYKNNNYAIGDFEQQISLIDAYNTMTSDRINDKAQFIDAILVIYGAMLSDEDDTDDALDTLKAKKLLELPEGSNAEYLVRQLDENGMETLRDALKEDIYTFSHVPNLTDKEFAGNSSGVAMEYKLLGLEMLTKAKERWYRRGLRERIEMFLNYLGLQGGRLGEEDIEVTFSRSLPKNLVELSQIVSNLADDVSLETRLSLLPFVKDPKAEAEKVKVDEQGKEQATEKLFGKSNEAGSEND